MGIASMLNGTTTISPGSTQVPISKNGVACSPPLPDQLNNTSIVAMIAIQRSGTHLLREILNSNPRVAMSPEPFNRDTRSFCWYKHIATLPPDRQPPRLSAEAMPLLDGFIEALDQDIQHNVATYGRRKVRPLLIGLDVKYNQLKSIAPAYSDLRLRPFLLDYLAARQARIIHLVRRNLAHTAISAIIANLRNVWQNYDRASINGQYRIQTDELIRYMWWIKAEREAFESLAGDLNMHTCYYEDLAADLKTVGFFGRFPQKTTALSSLAAFLNIPNRFRNYGYIRKVINRPYNAIIENYDEVIAAIKDSPFSEFAETLAT